MGGRRRERDRCVKGSGNAERERDTGGERGGGGDPARERDRCAKGRRDTQRETHTQVGKEEEGEPQRDRAYTRHTGGEMAGREIGGLR